MSSDSPKRRGRPLGFRLSENSKRAISLAKIGQRHTQETKDKISRSLILYFKKKNLLSDELTRYYSDGGDGLLTRWISEAKGDIDDSEGILPTKMLNNKTKIEITCGQNIEYLKHNMTPEFIVILKEELIYVDDEEIVDILRGIIEV